MKNGLQNFLLLKLDLLTRDFQDFFIHQSSEARLWIMLGTVVLFFTPFVIAWVLIKKFNEKTFELKGYRPISWVACALSGITFWLFYWSWFLYHSKDSTGWTLALVGGIVFLIFLFLVQCGKCGWRGLIALPLTWFIGAIFLPAVVIGSIGFIMVYAFAKSGPKPVWVINK